MENIFEKGCLVQLSASVWGASRKINPGKITDVISSHQWLTASKKLVDPDSLKPIKKIVNASRIYLGSVSLPFPIQGMAFVPKEMISVVDEKLKYFKKDFNQSVESFIKRYDELRSMAIEHLGELFSEMDYPLNIHNKFSFIWRFVVLDVPNNNTRILAPEVYEREKEKFIHTMEEARVLAIESLRVEFSDLIKRMTERFTTGQDGKPKVFKNSTVHNFYEFFETFKQRNIFRDKELNQLVDQAQKILGGKTADLIRSNSNLKEQIRSEMKIVEKSMSEILSRPRRKIIMN